MVTLSAQPHEHIEARALSISIHPDYDISKLVYAMIERAAHEAALGDEPARDWIRSDGLVWMDTIFNVTLAPARVESWIAAGCPIPRGLRKITR